MKKSKKLQITIKSFVNWGDKEKPEELIKLMNKYGIVPLKYDKSEKTKYNFEANAFFNFWMMMEKKHGLGIPFIKGKGFYTSINWGGAMPNQAWFTIDSKIFMDEQAILNFTKDFFNWGEAAYGYATLDERTKKMYTPGNNIEDCLGNIAWANFFSKPYVDMWGEEKLLNAPAWKKEKLENGGFMFLASKSIFTDSEEAEKNENCLKEYLGEKYFYKNQNKPQISTYNQIIENFLNPPLNNGYEAPDFKKYYNY